MSKVNNTNRFHCIAIFFVGDFGIKSVIERCLNNRDFSFSNLGEVDKLNL